MGTGLDVAVAQRAQQSGLQAIASGGVSTLDDVERAFEAGLSGVIIGRALYEGQIRLEDALQVGPKNLLLAGRKGHAG
jgi:phosphoribosylformimino-5-aminoimidazole carboxamide ribotide isomerase